MRMWESNENAELTVTTSTNHRRMVAQHCINGDCLSQWRMPKFEPL